MDVRPSLLEALAGTAGLTWPLRAPALPGALGTMGLWWGGVPGRGLHPLTPARSSVPGHTGLRWFPGPRALEEAFRSTASHSTRVCHKPMNMPSSPTPSRQSFLHILASSTLITANC